MATPYKLLRGVYFGDGNRSLRWSCHHRGFSRYLRFDDAGHSPSAKESGLYVSTRHRRHLAPEHYQTDNPYAGGLLHGRAGSVDNPLLVNIYPVSIVVSPFCLCLLSAGKPRAANKGGRQNIDSQRSVKLRIIIIWLAILLMGSFWLTVRTSSEPVSMAVIPEVPREGEPILAIFKLNNPASEPINVKYQFYANGELMKEGATTIPSSSSKLYEYAYTNPLKLGEQLKFVVKTQSERGEYEGLISSPPYPPQVWSSFVSFASFSTSVMSSMSTMTYYQSTFGSDIGLNVGLVASAVLIGLLIFLELTRASLQQKTVASLGRLRLRFSTVTWILFIIFVGMVYTKVVMILTT